MHLSKYRSTQSENASFNIMLVIIFVLIKDNAKPIITCPGDIEVPVGENNSALIYWDEEKAVATDNSGNATITIFGRPRQSPIRMGLGYHQLRYVAKDHAGNIASCIRRIQVLGKNDRIS